MSVSWPWLIAALLAATAGIAGAVWHRVRRDVGRHRGIAVAHAERLTALPRYQRRVRRHRRALVLSAVAAGVLVLSTSALAARPLRHASAPPVLDNRDIMLCLDVSGSMVEYNDSILDRFAELVAGFEGERIAMTIFNASAVPAFPLTTDHRFVTEEFARFQQTFAERGIDALAGTLEGDGTSIVPDGIASCALGLPAAPDGRSRAMIVTTDNIVEGAAALSMTEVTALLIQRDIRAYVVFPLFSFEQDRPAVEEMRSMAIESGGQFFGTENPTAVASIVAEVEAMERARLDVEPTEVRYVDTTRWLLIAVAAAVVLGLTAAWARR